MTAPAPEPTEGSGRQLWSREPGICPAGWATGPPDFVGVGVQRCGTSWWYNQILAHPGVCFDDDLHFKELGFFDRLHRLESLPEQYVARYHRHFPHPPDHLVGEWTPDYMVDPWSIGHLRQAAPDTRILVLLRDPVERHSSGLAKERRAQDTFGRPIPPLKVELNVLRGFYYQQVQRVLDSFPRDRILILQYERCLASYDQELRRTYEFLGLDPGFRPDTRLPREGPGYHLPRTARGSRLAHAYAHDATRLAQIAPEVDLSLWPNIRELVAGQR